MDKRPCEYFVGCLLGGAIGDALGAPIEFLKLSEIRDKYGKQGISGYVEFGNNRGEFTDDTQMTLFTAEALLRAEHRAMLKGIGPAINIIAHHSYLRWLHTQGVYMNTEVTGIGSDELEPGWLIQQRILFKRRAPGNTCLSALESMNVGTINNPINDSKGCGTIMRVAPVGLMYPGDSKYSFQVACELSAITHGHPTGYLSAGFFAAIISSLAVGSNIKEAIIDVISILKEWEHHEETLRAIESAIHLSDTLKTNGRQVIPEDIEKLGQGWIAEEALSMSLLASLIHENDFDRGVLFAVNHGGDSDSTGSITGNILGLINGADRIPYEWIKNILGNEIVAQVGKDLHTRVVGDPWNRDIAWWKRYPGY